ncbi:C39 family peptidase [Ornithinibacillus bavariensis]|uniref:C39 family peptidase n=1 Tax=Ornithinibacillus bavariensis TaxID=545502 RepID=UPI000EDFD6DC|nr:hypothetical protein [Ornithinibacillus sp.]
MKLILRNSFLLFIAFTGTILLITQGDKLYAFVHDIFDESKGVITIVNVDSHNGYPINGATFQIIDPETKQKITELITSSDGIAESEKLPLNRQYQVIQSNVVLPYQVNDETLMVELKTEKETIEFQNEISSVVTAFKRNDNNELIPTEMKLPVEATLQQPELPNGCEVTSLAAILTYYGYEADKTELADDYLPKVPFEVINGKLYGANPMEAYAGDPRSKNQGFYSYVQPIIETANLFFKSVKGAHQPVDISGSTEKELLSYILEGIPVIIWTTIDQRDPLFNYSWYIRDTDKRIDVLRNSHTVVLTGFSENQVFVMDPLKGNIAYPKKRFFEIYEMAGSHAMIIQ